MKMRIKPVIVDVVEDDGMWLDKSTMTYYDKDSLEPVKERQGLDSQEDNLARFAMYWYGDDDSMFLSNVFVGKDMRHHGWGNFILGVADEVANMYNADRIYLKTRKGSFAHKWYKRHGYVDDETDEEDKTMIWMKKEV